MSKATVRFIAWTVAIAAVVGIVYWLSRPKPKPASSGAGTGTGARREPINGMRPTLRTSQVR